MVQHSASISQALLKHISKSQHGLEVAPYFEPFVRKPEYNITYTDYIDNKEIQKKALENPNSRNPDVPLIDFLWTPGKPILDCLHKADRFDYIIASHVFEHIANPIGWMTDLLSSLKIGGRLALFVPDRRWSPDYSRRETSFGDILGWWIEQPDAPTVGQVLDFMTQVLNLSHDTPPLDWNNPEQIRSIGTFYPTPEIISTGIALYNDRPYLDVHCTVWTAMSFQVAFEQVIEAGLIGCRLVEIVGETTEFLAIFEKTEKPRLSPPEKKSASSSPVEFYKTQFADVDHKLDILRHDLTFLIQNSHNAAGAVYRTAENVSEIADNLRARRPSRWRWFS